MTSRFASVAVCAALFAPAQDFQPIRFGDPPAELAPLFPDADLDPDSPTPDELLGQALGTRPASHAEVLAYFDLLDQASERIAFTRTARTHEGRELGYAVVTAPANHARLDSILAGVRALHDPRAATGEVLDAALEGPAVAWLAYSIHGDELSGVDAALAVAHLLAADRSPATARMLEELVVVIDPIQNPDGRERMLGMVRQHAGYQPVLGNEGMQRGTWPWGRGNHYLFDMNRDWIVGVCPETRARWSAVARFRPQLFVDAHEMGGLDTFLFSPPREPIQLHQWTRTTDWPRLFARDQADAFDARGWSYYTREWFEGWGPYYTDSWATLSGAIGILYEQARYAGQPLRRASGEIATYRDAVAHQAVSSLANLRTLARERKALLADFAANARRNLAPDTLGNDRLFAFAPGRNPSREARFVELLTSQGIECRRLTEPLSVANARSTLALPELDRDEGAPDDELTLPAGAIVITPRQPLGSLVKAYLEFDPRFDDEVLAKERTDLEQRAESGVYDVTAWSLPLAFDLDAWWFDHAGHEPDGGGAWPLVTALATPSPGAVRHPRAADAQGAATAELGRPPYGWVVDGADDRALAFAVRALEAGLALHVAEKAFTTGLAPSPSDAGDDAPDTAAATDGTDPVSFARGSLLVRRVENPDLPSAELVDACARAAGVRAYAVHTARSHDDGPDLGGGHFTLLERPRVALFGNTPFAPDTYGHLWHTLDVELGLPVTLLDAQQGAVDLRPYNVLVLPPARGLEAWLKAHAAELATWVRSGGTLIAVGRSAAALCAPELELTSVRRRRDVLEDLERYAWAAWREREARDVRLDPGRVWGDPRPAARETAKRDPAAEPAGGGEKPADAERELGDAEPAETGEPGGSAQAPAGPNRPAFLDAAAHPDPATHDAWLRRFAPQGAFARGLVDQRSWLTAGAGPELPVFVQGDHALATDTGIQTAVRLAPAERLRLSGLIWPEAAERLAESAWLSIERRGHGQVVLFAAMPGFRGLYRGTGRLFANAVVLGPGAGANPARDW